MGLIRLSILYLTHNCRVSSSRHLPMPESLLTGISTPVSTAPLGMPPMMRLATHVETSRLRTAQGSGWEENCLLDVSSCNGVGVRDCVNTILMESLKKQEDGKKMNYSGPTSVIKTMAVVGE